MAGRSPVPQHPGRRHRQHPPHRDLHRQTVFARRSDRPARPGRIPLVRNAAGCAHESRPAIAAARADRLVLARAARRHAGALGHGAARPLHARAFRLGGFPRSLGRSQARRLRVRSGLVRGAAAIPLPAVRQRAIMRGVELELRQAIEPWYVLGEEGHGRRHRALRRFLGRAAAGQGRRLDRRPPRRHLQRPPRAARLHRPLRRIRRRRALQGLESGVVAASDHRRARAADLRHRRHLEPALARRLRLSRRASRRPQLRDLPGQFLRGGSAPPRPLPGSRPYRRVDRRAAARTSRSNTRPRSICGARAHKYRCHGRPTRQRSSNNETAGLRAIRCRLSAAARHFRRDDGWRRPRARALAAVSRHAGGARRRGDQSPLRRRRSLFARFRRVLSRLRGCGRHRAAMAAQPRAAAHRACRMARTGSRPHPARRTCSKPCWPTPTVPARSSATAACRPR